MMKPPSIVLGALLALLAMGCENNPQEISSLSRKVIEVEEGKNIKGIFSQSANLKAYLSAPLMRRVKADTQYVEFPASIHVDFYNEARQLENVVSAKYARYFENMGKVFLRDSVVVYNMTGDTLYCKTLWWDQNQAIFYSDDSVTVQTIPRQLRGVGFWAKSDFSKYTFREVVGSLPIPEQTDSAAAPAPPIAPISAQPKPQVVGPPQ